MLWQCFLSCLASLSPTPAPLLMYPACLAASLLLFLLLLLLLVPLLLRPADAASIMFAHDSTFQYHTW